MGRFARLSLLLLASSVSVVPSAAQPETPRKPTTVTYQGVKVSEDFRWLEDVDDPAVKKWWKAQNEHAEKYIDQLKDRRAISARWTAMLLREPTSFDKLQCANGVLCGQCDGSLVILKSENDTEPARTIVDLDDSPAGKEARIDHFYLSEDGRYVAASLSSDGLEEGTIHVYETATGKKLPDVIPQASAAPGGDMAWKHDASGFYYTRYPDATPRGKTGRERYARQEIWFHTLGTKPDADAYVCGRDFPLYTRFFTMVSEKGQLLIAAYTGYGSDETAWYLVDAMGKLTTVAKPEDRVPTVSFGPNDTLILESWNGTPRGRLLRVPLSDPDVSRACVLVPQSDAVLHSWMTTDHYAYVIERKDGSERLRVFALSGRELPPVSLPPFTAVDELLVLRDEIVLYKLDSFVAAPQWFRYDPSTRKSERVALSEKSRTDHSDIEVVREYAVAKDGTPIPLTILRRKDCKLDGDRPVLLTGYGSSRSHERPNYQLGRRFWYDKGGVCAIAHTRGEAELGDDWHRAAKGPNKKVSVDDFNLCAEHLIAQKYTRPGRLALWGGSDGGLLMGMAITQRPDLYAAAVIDCGVLDVPRLEKDYFGPHCATEYGQLDTAKNVKIALDFSPVHQVKAGTQYPAVWLRVGANDRRVDPVHTWKMAAQLQASGSKKPALVSTTPGEGHEFYTSTPEETAFLFDQIGVKFRGK